MTRVVTATRDAIEDAAARLREGHLVAFPTETVYGLGAVATSDRAVAAIYTAKGRPSYNPLIVHVADRPGVTSLAHLDTRAERLAEAFWPGPLTLVLPAKAASPISWLATAGLATIAIRVPSHPVAQALLRATMLPVAAPSANPSGLVSPTTAQHVAHDLDGKVDLVLDGGASAVGLESTVIDLSDPDITRLLRPGGLPREEIEAAVGRLEDGLTSAAPTSPGQLASHYAPSLPVRLDALEVDANEVLLAFGPVVPAGAKLTLNLSLAGDLAEAAGNLYRMLREGDRVDARGIAVMPVPMHGLGEAINDRLRRAAAPRVPS